MAIRLPEIFCDAKQMLEDNLATYRRLIIKRYGSLFASAGDVIHFHIDDVEDDQGYSNLDMSISYKERVLIEDRFETIERHHQLRLLSPVGDDQWTYTMINRVWEGDCPSTVAVDTDTRQVFLVAIQMSSVELIEFGMLTEQEFDAFITDCEDRNAYRIKLDESAMFKVIDGSEGMNHLRQTMVIELNCGVVIRVQSGKENIL